MSYPCETGVLGLSILLLFKFWRLMIAGTYMAVLVRDLNAQLDNILNREISTIGNKYWLELSCYSVYCDNCGCLELSRAGFRKNKRKGDVQRYICKKCGRYVSPYFYKGSHLPLWVFDAVLFYVSIGLRYQLVPVVVAREGKARTGKPFNISVPTVYNIVRRATVLLDTFEYNIRHYFIPAGKVISDEWQIDDRYHNWRLNVEREIEIVQMKFGVNLDLVKEVVCEKKLKWSFMYPTCVVETNTCYGLAVFVGPRRTEETARSALRQAIERSTYTPLVIKCDGHKPFIKAIEGELPSVQIICRTKEEDVSIVNAAETFWSIFNLVVPKRRFRQPETLADAADLTRHYMNMLRPHEKLGGKPPLEALGFNLPRSAKDSWAGLLDFAYKYNKLVEYKRRQALKKVLSGKI